MPTISAINLAQPKRNIQYQNNIPTNACTKNPVNDSVNFTGLIPSKNLKNIKCFIFDLDESLLEGSPEFINKVLQFAQNAGKIIYSSARDIKKITPLIEDGTLATPDYCVCNNGLNIYKNIDGELREINSWQEDLQKHFNRDKIKAFMQKMADKLERNNQTHKIVQYETYGSALNIHFMLSENLPKENLQKLVLEELNKHSLKADLNFITYGKGCLEEEKLNNYFDVDVAKIMRQKGLPLLKQDESLDIAIITAKTDKGEASEYIRKALKLKPQQVFATGDDINDFSNANKKYFFALPSNATSAFKNMLENANLRNVFRTSKPGSEGIWQAIEP